MYRKVYLLLILATMLLSYDFAAGQNTNPDNQLKASFTAQGGFTLNLRAQRLSEMQVKQNLLNYFSLSNDFSFEKIKEKKSVGGLLHINYQQFYKGIKVNNGICLMHSKDGIITSVNGKIMQQPAVSVSMISTIDASNVQKLAMKAVKVIKLFHQYEPEKVIDFENGNAVLAYKIKLDGTTDSKRFVMYNVLINAHTGDVLKKVPLIADNDVEATAETYYSGTQSIITDQFEGGYRLRDNSRKVETYDVGGLYPSMESTDLFFEDPADCVNNSTNWGDETYLMSTTLNAISNDNLLAGIGFDFTGNTITGNLLRSDINKIVSGNVIQVKTGYDLSLLSGGSTSLPVVSDNLYVPVDASTYNLVYAKDSLVGDASTFEYDVVATDEDSKIDVTINDMTEGQHSWQQGGNEGTYNVTNQKNPNLDAHWGIEKSYDYYKNNYSYYSYNNDSNSVIRNYFNGTLNTFGTQNNAAAVPAPYNAMTYGTGDGIDFGPFVAIDITGHEFSHLITGNNADLEYSGESGALNESFSDMMGTAIEFYAKPDSANWLIGENTTITMPYLRSMSDPKAPASFSPPNPNAVPQPNTYLGQYWASTASPSQLNDNGGVHTNSGVGNKWFYLLANGGSGTNDNNFHYEITGVGLDKAGKIAFEGFTNYLTSSSQYLDAYDGTLAAAADLYGETSNEYNTVKSAWKAVGIPEDTTTSVKTLTELQKKITLYPNPNSGTFEIHSDMNKNVDAAIFNITGSKVSSFIVKPGNNDINLSQVSKGIYFIKYQNNQSSFTQKLIVK